MKIVNGLDEFPYLSKPNQYLFFQMKILKYLLFLVLLLIIGSAIYFGTKDGNYDIQDSVVIPAAPEIVFDKVNNFKTWENWSPWKTNDPNIVFNYAEKTSGEGASFSWDGKRSGAITTTKVIPNKEIHQDFTFQSSTGKRNAEMIWNFEELGDSTKVGWTTKGEHTLIDKVFHSIKGSDFVATVHQMNREGLQNISEAVVADMKKYSINVDGVTQYGGGYYMYTTSVAKEQEVGEKAASMMSMVENFISRNNLNVSGNPFILYNEKDPANNTVIFSTGFPIKEKVITPDGSPVVCGFMDPVSAVKVSLKGNYGNLHEASQKGLNYIRENSLQIDPSRKIFEVYAIGPQDDPNPANWLTEIYIPILSSEEPAESTMLPLR